MKTKDIYSITLKIIGLIAFWKSVQTFSAVISGIGIYSSLFTNSVQMNTSFMIAIVLAMFLNFLMPLIVAILFLYRTERVLSIIRIKEHGNIDLNLNKLVLYHMFIMVFGLMIVIHGAGNFIDTNYKTETKTEYTTDYDSPDDQSSNNTEQEKVSVTNSKSTNINYFALIEIILGIIMLANATEIAKKVEKNFDSKTGRLIDETNNEPANMPNI